MEIRPVDLLLALEWMNAFLLFINLGVILTFALILLHNLERWREPLFKAAIGIEVYHVGETGRQFWYWLWSHFADRGVHWLQGQRVFVLYLLGAAVAIGAVCMIRVFSERRYGPWLWAPAILVAMAGATVLVNVIPR